LRDGLHAIAAELQQTPQALALYADGATGITISPRAGRITYRNDAEFFDGLRWALSVAVNPIEPIRSRERVPVSRLFIQIKNTFDTLGWMAPIGQGISQGRIISRYSLSPDEGLTVDFAQQEQDKTFLAGAEEAGLSQLKGHKSTGGMRASIYNAMPLAGVQALVDYLQEFERRHG